jgi:two-component system LytT family response regulator
MISALIADDEPLARQQLRDLLAVVPWLQCIGEAADGLEALAAIERLQPQLVFLDIQMPGLTGLEVLARASHRPAVIFTTAYDRFAVTAFELHAVDYLLKPFGRQRFESAIARVRESIEQGGVQDIETRARSAVNAEGRLARLFVRERGKIIPVSVGAIERMEARDDYVALYTATRRYLVRIPMNDLEAALDPTRFARIHRCHIVNLDAVICFTPTTDGRLQAELRSGVRILASRARSKGLRGLAM